MSQIGDTVAKKNDEKQFVIRAKHQLLTSLAHVAARRGVSAAEVARNALEIHLAESMVWLVDNDAEFVAKVEASGQDPAAVREMAHRDLERFRAAAFEPRRAYHVLDEVHRASGGIA